MATLAVSAFFFRFWNKTGDRLFLLFSLSFALIAIERFVLIALHNANETHYAVYLIRFVAYCLIIFGIVDKNIFHRKN